MSQQILRRQTWLVSALAGLTGLAMVLPLQEVQLAYSAYPLLHATLDFLSIVVAFLVFATVWHTPAKAGSVSLLLITTAMFAAGWLDYLHVLYDRGMPERVALASAEKEMVFWLVARFLVAVTLFGVSFFHPTTPSSQGWRYGILLGYTLINGLVISVVFLDAFRAAIFIEGVGQTDFKIACEWAITSLMVLAAWRFFCQARSSAEEFPALMFGTTAISALGGLFFVGHSSVSDAHNLLGHLYKVVSYSLIYRAVFVISIRQPYNSLAVRTEQLGQANDTLRIQDLALESTTAFVFVTDADGRFRWRNRASRTLLHPDHIGELSLFAAPVTPDPVIADAIRAAVVAHGRWSGVLEIEDGSGNQVIVNRTVTSLLSANGELEGFVSVAENVTENRRARDRHKRVLDTAIDGFLIFNIQGRLLEVNEAFVRMSGFSVTELLGMTVWQFDPSSHLQRVQENLKEKAQLGHDQFETQFRHKQGHEVLVAVSLTFDPEVQQFFVFVRDISEQARLAQVQRDLERQLQQAQKMEAIGQLTGGIAHDFNNILVSVLGYSKLALDRLVPDKQSKLATYLLEIITASERARDLIAKMLAFTRIKPSSPTGLISPATVVREVLAMVRPSIPSTIALDVRLDDDLGIEMDGGELNQILINLIINARDAIHNAGQIGIYLHRVNVHGDICAVSQQRLSGAYLALEVSDNGSGIAPEHMPRLFDPFFTTKDVGKGTGLGLSMVQGILRRSGGHIVVKSQTGLGSRFQLLFPVDASQSQVSDTAGDVPMLPEGGGQHIAVVDDEPAVTRYLCELLEGQGYRVSSYANAAEMLRAMDKANQGFDLLITDQTMPGMTGIELAEQLHRTHPDLPVILCTGCDREMDDRALLCASIRQRFTKPVVGNDLLAAVAAALGLPK